MTHAYEHPRPALTADVVVVRGQGAAREILLIRRAHDPFAGSWALPGGFIDAGETPQDAARRELSEETGIVSADGLRLVGVYGAPGRDPRGWTVSVAYRVSISGEPAIRAGDDADDARWFAEDQLPPLAFDHDRIVTDALGMAPADG